MSCFVTAYWIQKSNLLIPTPRKPTIVMTPMDSTMKQSRCPQRMFQSFFGQGEVSPIIVDPPSPVRVLIPQWHYSLSKQQFIYGGITADMGWILTVARYALTMDNTTIQFPPNWGHSEVGSWESIFEPIHSVHPTVPRFELSGKHDPVCKL